MFRSVTDPCDGCLSCTAGTEEQPPFRLQASDPSFKVKGPRQEKGK